VSQVAEHVVSAQDLSMRVLVRSVFGML